MVSLKARTAGLHKLRVLLHPESSLLKENPLPELVAESQIRVTEAAASSVRSRLSSFWPPQGPIAGTPAGAVIQVGAAMVQGPPERMPYCATVSHLHCIHAALWRHRLLPLQRESLVHQEG